MKLILIIFLFISNCITDERTACQLNKNEDIDSAGSCEGLLILPELDKYDPENPTKLKDPNSLDDPNSLGKLLFNYAIVRCVIQYNRDKECRKKRAYVPVFGRSNGP
jgi:hypothetical protein